MTPASLNLTPKRGPSVWDQVDSNRAVDFRWIELTMAGALLARAAIRRGSTERLWLATLGTACIAAALFHDAIASRLSTTRSRIGHAFRHDAYDAVDVASADSFPASDAPASMRAGQ